MNTKVTALIMLGTLVGVATLAPRTASAQINTFHNCGSGPAANEAYIYHDNNFSGQCGAVYAGSYPFSGTTLVGAFGVDDNQVSSMKIGSNTRVRVFTDYIYAGNFIDFGPGDHASMPSGWNDVVSSMRVVDNSRSVTCNDLRQGEFAVFRDIDLTGDCVVLPYAPPFPAVKEYYRAVDFGIADNSISSIDAGPLPPNGCPPGQSSSWFVYLYKDQFAGGGLLTVPANWIYEDLRSFSFNDTVSSIYMVEICLY